jgi:hypothetical protein
MPDLSLMAVPSEGATPVCANCGAELVADQRYCLACGHPVSPVRLAFLDVLEEDRGRPGYGLMAPATIDMPPLGYGPAPAPGLGGWLRRNTGVLSLVAVLVLCLIAGLLVGHWVTQNGKAAAPGTQTVKLEGLGALAPAASGTTAAGTSTTKAATAKSSAKKEEEEEAKESAAEAKTVKAPPAATKVSSSQLQKLSTSSGKKHEEEINALGDKPIETGG